MSGSDWQPTAPWKNLALRAHFLAHIRRFFAARNVLEVETPLLAHSSVTDPQIHSFSVDTGDGVLYLQTSPEFAMKRLLAAASGDIFQICKAFRKSEQGRRHNPEFTMLEWYRVGFDHQELMDEVEELIGALLHTPKALRSSYAELFQHYLQLNPHTATVDELKTCAAQHQVSSVGLETEDRDDWLDLLMSHLIEPQLGHQQPQFIYDYPTTQAALAKIRLSDPPVAERFELYYRGVELANGFHELCDAEEQRQRFQENNAERQRQGQAEVPIDERFLLALQHGLPQCAGVAIGLDRLLMLASESTHIQDVISFTTDRA